MRGSSSRSLPRSRSLDELVDHFDTHDMGEDLDQMPRAEVEVDIKRRRRLVAIDADILAQVRQVAKKGRVSSEDLINAWLRERLSGSRQ
jgi:hypothetical protein